jgi:tetratricopeptide (TPR) repeat protein
MRLLTLGKVRLENCSFSRPKPLLLLSYITLEGPQDRRKLADLFWQGDTQKNLGKLSVVLSQFKKEGVSEVFPEKSGIDPLPSLIKSDTHEFLDALEKNQLQKALEFYHGSFLHDLGKPLDDLDISDEILDWVLEKREFLADKAQKVMLELSELALKNNQPKEARELAERAYQLSEAPEMEPHRSSRLQHILDQTQSSLSKQFDRAIKANLDELPEGSRKTFLALSLQDEPNLTIIRNALKISLGDIAEARENLLFAGLINQDTQVLAPEMAERWLGEHPTEWLPLLLALARATPPEHAFKLYYSIYEKTQGFGGVGDFTRARAAYTLRAKTMMDRLEFSQTAQLLSELRGVEKVVEAEPETESRFLEAYALERMGQFKEALELIQTLPESHHNPNITALSSVLLWRTGKSDEAKIAAENATKSGLDWLWARATATNTLGYLAHSSEKFIEASAFFKKAASLFQTCGELNRWIGSLNNYAIALDAMAETEERNGANTEKVEAIREEAKEAYLLALEALDQVGQNESLQARILINLGVLWELRKDWEQAEKYYSDAIPFAEKANDVGTLARIYLDLGSVQLKANESLKAKVNHQKAMRFAALAGEYLIQGMAAGNLAIGDDDPDGMEVSLELLEQSGSQEQLVIYQKHYETILRKRLEETLAENNSRRAQLLFKKLGELYQKQSKNLKVEKIEDALNILSQSTNMTQDKAFLLNILQDTYNHNPILSN